MAEITAALVKDLREKTGAGMMDCKRALGEANGDIEQAVDWLRKKGLAAAAKKAGRVAAEGLVGVVTEGRVGAAVEINSETDFVARNEKFQDFVRSVSRAALSAGDEIATLKSTLLPEYGDTTDAQLTHLVATIGENMNLRRARRLEVAIRLPALLWAKCQRLQCYEFSWSMTTPSSQTRRRRCCATLAMMSPPSTMQYPLREKPKNPHLTL